MFYNQLSEVLLSRPLLLVRAFPKNEIYIFILVEQNDPMHLPTLVEI
jgi:hypothetical protein